MQGIKVLVEAVDRVTAPMRRMAGAFRAINLAPLRDQLGRVMSAAKSAGAEIGRMVRNVSLGFAGLATGVGALMMRVMRSSNEAAIAAERVGVSLQSFQGFSYAAQRSGAETADMADALKDLNLKILEAVNGNDDLASGFRRMGIDLKDAQGNLRPTEEIFVELADAFAAVPDGAKKSAAAIALMGEAGLKMIPMLNRGSDSLRETMEEAERLGLVLDEKTASAFKAMSLDLTRLQAAGIGLQNTIASKLLPVIQPLVQSFTDWIVANRELIATNILSWMESLPALFESAKDAALSWKTALEPVTAAIGVVVDQLGPMNASLGFMSILIAGKLVPVIGPLVRLTWLLTRAFGGLAFALGRLAIGPLVASLGRVATAIRSVTGVMAFFNAVLFANPIGLVIAAVAALAGAAYLIYQNWDTVGPWFGELWGAVKRSFNGFVEFVTGVFTGDFGKAWDGIKEIAAGFRDWLAAIWSPVFAAFRRLVNWVDRTFGTRFGAALDDIGTAAKGVADGLAALWTAPQAAFDTFLVFVRDTFGGGITGALDGIEATAASVVGFLQGLWAPVQSAWQAFADWVSGTFGPLVEGALALADRLRNLVPGQAAATAPAEAVQNATPNLPALTGPQIRDLARPMSGADLEAIGSVRRMSAPDVPTVFGNGRGSPWGGGSGGAPERVDHGGTLHVKLDEGLKAAGSRMNDNRFDISAGPSLALS